LKKGIILELAVPMRNEPSDRAEMVNQLLYGEQYEVLEEREKWISIKTIHDSYKGWIDLKQHSENKFDLLEGDYCNAYVTLRHKQRGELNLTPGSFLPSEEILREFNFELVENDQAPKDLRESCMLFLNAPYLWGGRTPYGIDCSGFTQLVFRLLCVSIPRDASEQVERGEQISFVEESREGDLAFFDNAEGRITHVGIILEEGGAKKIIHASGRVRIDNLDHNGIFNEETQSYSHKLRTIKRIL
jgi:cell wall-associated NlpC family hydrolase